MLFIDGISKGVYHENVGRYIQDYESAFDLLTQLASDGWTLEFAIVVDNGECITLPVEAFDGQPVLKHIKALEEQWDDLLRPKPARQASLFLGKDWYLQLDTYYKDLRNHLTKLIFLRRRRLNILQDLPNGSLQSRSIIQHQQLLESALHLYQQTVEHQHRNWQRLQALEVQHG